MVNGNYILYGDKPASDSEIVEDHVHGRTLERKRSRKANRTANELQRTLNMAQLDNETDSAKFEKTKEPKLLRYVPTTEIEENYVAEKFETHDLKPREDPAPRRYAFTKKPKNPTDGSVHYAYSRSSSNCSSPNLPTIVEHGEQYGTYRIRDRSPSCDLYEGYENKMDKYFVKPRERLKFPKKVGYNGSHPDSLYRVNAGAGAEDGKVAKAMRLLRWPLALLVVCVALAVFVYFLMPNTAESQAMNGTYWEASPARAQVGSAIGAKPEKAKHKPPERNDLRSSTTSHSHGTKTTEIDFYDADSDRNVDIHSLLDKIKDMKANKKLPIAPVFPTHITPEVQYGDSDKIRTAKRIEEKTSVLPLDTTAKPRLHITQNPEKPLAIYFKEGDVSTSTEISTDRQATNDFVQQKEGTRKATENYRPAIPIYFYGQGEKVVGTEPVDSIRKYENDHHHVVSNVNFTSGHSKLFGISIEDAEFIKSTTPSALYNTKVSPTLPMWRDSDDATTKRYPVNYAPDIQPQCRSTHLPLCRGVLQYDLTSMATAFPSGIDIHALLPDIEYVVASNCSERMKHFACALLEPECSVTPNQLKRPCYNLCKAVVDYCEELITPRLQPVFNCSQYQRRNCMAASAPCFGRELQCGDGSCVPRDWMCDGSVDCPGGEDEATCARCSRYEFQCQSGLCLQNAWLCDGYADCPDGDDESAEACGRASRHEPGEEISGSAPAPSVRRPNRLPAHKKTANSPAEESSKELLMTSDSSNALRRNYTRRPSPSRLTPYVRTPVRQPQPAGDPDKHVLTRPSTEVNKPRAREEEPGELNFFDDYESIRGQPSDRNRNGLRSTAVSSDNEPTGLKGPPPPQSEYQTRATYVDKKKSKLQRLLDGAALMRKVQKQIDDQTPPPMDGEENLMKGNNTEEFPEEARPYNLPGSQSAHASPCPSGELRCVDGRCITLAQLCDGNVDCSDHADEDNCFT